MLNLSFVPRSLRMKLALQTRPRKRRSRRLSHGELLEARVMLSATTAGATDVNAQANAAPVVTGFDGAVTYSGSLTVLDADAIISDSDSANFAGGQVQVSLTSNAQAGDRLYIRNQGTAAGKIGVSGSQVTYGGTVIGTVSGGTNINQPLTITLNTNATAQAATELLRNVQFQNLDANVSASPRTVQVTVSDGDGGTSVAASKTVNIQLSTPPVIADFDGTVDYTGSLTVLDDDVSVTDVDSANFAGGELTVSLGANAEALDRLFIRNQGTAAGKIGVSGNQVTYGGTVIGTFSGGTDVSQPLTVSLNSSASAEAVTELLQSIQFRSLDATPSTLPRSVDVSLTDGDGGTSASVSKTISMQSSPVISNLDGNVTYNGSLTILDDDAVVTDVDSANLAGGQLVVEISGNAEADDRLYIRNGGTAAGRIGVSGNQVTYGGTVIGTFTGGTSVDQPLVVTFNSNATAEAAAELVQNIQFRSLSDTPSALPRTVDFTISDGDGGTSATVSKTVDINLNTAPVVTNFDGTVNFNGSLTLLDDNVLVTDVDSPNLAGGVVTVELTGNAEAEDRLYIRNQGTAAGKIGRSGNQITYGGTVIGTFTGGTSIDAPLQITLNSNATTDAVTELLRNVQFNNLSATPSALPRTVEVTVGDGDGGTSASVSKQINMQSAPVIANFDGSVTYPGTLVILDADATVTDVDSANLAGGELTVGLTVNAEANDRLYIRNQGTGAGKIGVSGNQVTFGGTVIGTFTGGTNINQPLTVSLNANATPAAVQELLRSVQFKSLSNTPSTLPRGVEVSLTDGDGGISTTVGKTINIDINAAPVIANLSGAVSTTGALTIIDDDVTVTDSDSPNFNGGQLSVALTANAEATDRLYIRNQGTGAGKIGVSGNQVTFGGTVIGTFTGGTSVSQPLTVSLNANADAAAVQELMRSIQYRSLAGSPSMLDRTVEFQLSDGDGGDAAVATKIVSYQV